MSTATFKAIRIEEILNGIDKGLPTDLGYLRWDKYQERYVVDVSKFDTETIKGISGMPITIHRRKAQVFNSAAMPTVESIMSEISNRHK